ncbi:hypothetical protein JZ751_007572 [Albula glossodonta]|uniref:Uncharacterized protein n=1 Tax=Albula glossodonta TaxID=121402 RepID=A0A8T2N1X6_9TELE|nr:hypothetical protein JZ751_007572 [Albula glossodonta]
MPSTARGLEDPSEQDPKGSRTPASRTPARPLMWSLDDCGPWCYEQSGTQGGGGWARTGRASALLFADSAFMMDRKIRPLWMTMASWLRGRPRGVVSGWQALRACSWLGLEVQRLLGGRNSLSTLNANRLEQETGSQHWPSCPLGEEDPATVFSQACTTLLQWLMGRLTLVPFSRTTTGEIQVAEAEPAALGLSLTPILLSTATGSDSTGTERTAASLGT